HPRRPRGRGAAPVTADLIARLRAVVAADDAIQHAHRERAAGRMHYSRCAWRGLYADRERADRELWGTHADDRAATARELLGRSMTADRPPIIVTVDDYDADPDRYCGLAAGGQVVMVVDEHGRCAMSMGHTMGIDDDADQRL